MMTWKCGFKFKLFDWSSVLEGGSLRRADPKPFLRDPLPIFHILFIPFHTGRNLVYIDVATSSHTHIFKFHPLTAKICSLAIPGR